MSNEPVDEEVMDQIRARLMQTGDWQRSVLLIGHQRIKANKMGFRISKLLKARLEETGYDDDLKDLAKGM